MRLFLHAETGRTAWRTVDPGIGWMEVDPMYEDDLPQDMSDEDYDRWFDESEVVDGARMGPRV